MASALGKKGGTWKWNRIRKAVIARDGGICTTCASTERLEVDHLLCRELGGSDDPWNLTTLCHNCHTTKTNADMRKIRILKRKRSTPSPYIGISLPSVNRYSGRAESLWHLSKDTNGPANDEE